MNSLAALKNSGINKLKAGPSIGLKSSKTPQNTMADTNQIKHVQPHGSSIPCPMCKTTIPISMYAIMENLPIFCPSCGIRLDLNKQASAKAIEALKELGHNK